MKGIILAGGFGSRLSKITKKIPKPMIKIGDLPLLHHQINLLRKYGIKNIIILTHYLSEKIEEYFRDGSDFGVNISYFKEEKPLGTAGGLKEIENELDNDFLVIYGDVMINMHLKRLINFHKRKKGICTLVIHPTDHPYDSDLIEIDNFQKIIAFHSTPHNEKKYFKNLANAGVYVMSPEVLKYLRKGTKIDFGRDIFPKLLKKEKLYGYKTAEYLKDIGTPERLKIVKKDYLGGKIDKLNLKYKRRAIFLDRDGVINKKVGLLYKPEDFELLPGVGKAIKLINKSEYLAIVITNQPVVARNLCTLEELEEIHKKMETLLGKENVYLDGIYYCPHHPDKGYPEENKKYKKECGCRKPKIGMITKASKDFNIELKHSYFIGDSFRDILCGKRAGAITVGVRTGDGCKNIKIQPDYMFENLIEAINFIVKEPYKKFFEKIYTYFRFSNKRPFVISIGGNTRSGKTTLATYFAQKFESLNKKVLVISLDNWLISHEVRKREDNVYTRFQIHKMYNDLLKFFNNKEIVLNKFDSFTREITKDKIKYKLEDNEIIILEGVVALSAKELRKFSHLKIFCEINNKLLKKRILDFYRWKGLPEEEIKNLYKKRKKDEYKLIGKDIINSDIVVK